MKELFGDRADAAVTRDLNQINNFETYIPIKTGNLSREEKNKALESILSMTEKRNGNIDL